jgi:CheY-like chemotaxis protein
VTDLASAEAALPLLRERRPDVIVSDIGMPGMDGHALLREVRAIEEREKWPRTPAVAVTAFASAGDYRKAIESGFDEHLPKPLDPERL